MIAGASPAEVGVVGAGRLGLTVAQAALLAGASVTLVTHGPDATTIPDKRAAVGRSLEREVRRGALSAAAAQGVLGRLHVTSHLADLAPAEVVVEAVPEELTLKQRVIAQIESYVAPGCVIASSTSSIPAAWLASAARQPERVVVTHYVWPAHRMPVVELSLHEGTSPSTRQRVMSLLAAQRKTVVHVADRPGFLITRALLAYWGAAVQLVVDGLGPVEVDTALEAFGFPLGPLRMMDAAGLATAASVHRRLRASGLPPHPVLERLETVVAGGHTGFYEHTTVARRPVAATATALRGTGRRRTLRSVVHLGAGDIVERVVSALAREVSRAVDEGVVTSWAEAGHAIDLAYGFPARQGGLHHWWSDRRPLQPNQAWLTSSMKVS